MQILRQILARSSIALLLVPGVIILAVSLGIIAMQSARQEVFDHKLRVGIMNRADIVRADLESELNQDMYLVSALVAEFAIHPRMTVPQFNQLAREIFARKAHMQKIAIAPDGVIKYIYPLQGNEAALGLDLAIQPEQRDDVRLARQSGDMVVSGPVGLIEGGRAIILHAPVMATVPGGRPGTGGFWGYVSVPLDMDGMFAAAGLRPEIEDLRLALRALNPDGTVNRVIMGDEAIFVNNPVLLDMHLPQGSWQIGAIPASGWNVTAPEARYIQIAGILLGALLVFASILVVKYIAALKEAEVTAGAASRAKSEFLANMSHEIRTPLNGVIGMLGVLEDKRLSSEDKRLLNTAQSSARSLLGIINDILDVARLEEGRFELRDAPFYLKETVEEVVALMQPAAREKGLKLAVSYKTAVPLWINADEGRVRQILNNLVGNAIKFTEQGEIKIRIVSRPLEDDQVAISMEIIDSGIGISEEDQKDLFERFEQVDSSVSKTYQGAGLGLSICRQLVQLMGGEITMDSEPGRGSTFRAKFTAPRAQPQSVDKQPKARARPRAAAASLNILVAEDNPVNQLLITKLLIEAGHTLETAVNGHEVLAALEKSNGAGKASAKNGGMKSANGKDPAKPFDLILMDVQMPEMDGIVAAQHIRDCGGSAAEIPIIALTAHAMEDMRLQCLEAGMQGFVAKPIEPEALHAEIASMMKAEAA